MPFSVRHSNSSNKTSPGHREQLKSTVPRKRLPAALSKLSPRELAALLLYKFGSPQESDEVRILSGLLKSNEFGLGDGQSLCFEQQILDVAIAATAAQQRFDIPVDGFDHT